MDLVLIWRVMVIFSVAVKAAPIVPKEITATEGDDATLATGLDKSMHVFFTDRNGALLLMFQNGMDVTENKSIGVYIKNGTLMISHVQRNYSKDYDLHIYRDGQLTHFSIRLNVNARLPPVTDVPSPGITPPPNNEEPMSLLGVYISLGLLGLLGLIVVLFLLYLKKKREAQKHETHSDTVRMETQDPKGESSCCLNMTEADSSASTSRPDSLEGEQEKEEEKLVTPKHI